MAEIDRESREAAERIMSHLIQAEADRKVGLSLLAHAIQLADSARKGCWSVTLKRDVIRVNVGKVEVLAIQPGAVRFVVSLGDNPAPLGEPIRVNPYTNIPNSAMYIVDASEAKSASRALSSEWDSGIRAAALSARRSPSAKAHSPGVIEMLRATVAPDLPDLVPPA